VGGVWVVKGSDPVLRDREVAHLVDELVGEEDRALVVEDFTVPPRRGGDQEEDGAPAEDAGGAGPVVTALVNAAQSPPFMTSQRIVVVRDYEQLPADVVAPVVDVLADLLPTTAVVFVAGGGRVVKALGDALSVATVRGGTARKAPDVLQGELERSGITFTGDAGRAVLEHVGEDLGRLGGLVDLLASSFGPGAHLDRDDVAPYLNEAGSVRSYELTNRIETGDVAGSLAILHRLLTVTSGTQPKPYHPLQVLGLLHSRYRKLARLDAPDVVSADDAHRVWAGKGSTYPARKGLEATRALGTAGIARAFALLHQADVGVKGATGMPEGAVLEVTVARLAQLHRGGGRGGSRGARRG
jgi:DNA polymerase III delta subunit